MGVDPGLRTTGYAVLDVSTGRARLLEAGVVRSRAETLPERVKDIYDGIAEVVAAFAPNAMAIEQLYSLYERPETAILMGHARGAIMLAAAQNGIPVVSYAATKIKKTTTGNGRAPKEQMQRAVQLELRLPRLPEPPDVADAIAVAFCHFTEARLTRLSSAVNPIGALLAEPPKRPSSPIWPQANAR